MRVTPAVAAQLLALNAAHEIETAPLSAAGLQQLLDRSWHLGLAGGDGAAGFLIALDDSSAHDGINFQWFKARHKRFVYIDRIIVAAAARGQGVARSLYDALFRRAAAAGVPLIGCEVNCDPPNPASDGFHARLGFAEVGRAWLPGGTKQVRYLARTTSDWPG
ncbi:MAG: GNAT family N-acetyltransferase [Sphingomonadales bacterium]|jgi:predicted GNAT superfamily acetyltransferase